MTNTESKNHWENIYKTKNLEDVSWYQEKPQTSLDFITYFNVTPNHKIIDIGGGDSFLVDNLLAMGYSDITVLDISAAALEKAKVRLGVAAKRVTWIVADVQTFKSQEKYDFWHDRAAFHFLTEKTQVTQYVDTVASHLSSSGVLVLGTFSKTGPLKCSGLPIQQYSKNTLASKFKKFFEKIKCIQVDHPTPFSTVQNFVFCSFKLLT